MNIVKPLSEGRKFPAIVRFFSDWLFLPGFCSTQWASCAVGLWQTDRQFLTGAAQSMLGCLKAAQAELPKSPFWAVQEEVIVTQNLPVLVWL